MRGIFLAFLFFNVVAFAWYVLAGPDDQQVRKPSSSTKNPYNNVPDLVLLNEVDPRDRELKVDELYRGGRKIERSQAVKEANVAASASTEAPKMHNGKELCEMVGPFEKASEALAFIDELAGIEIASEVQQISVPAGMRYWVYLTPSSTRKEALQRLGALQSQGVDSYVIPKGELENGISLGMFSQKSLADSRITAMRKLGLQPLLEEVERTENERWVMLKRGEGEKINKYTWEKLLEGKKMLQKRENYCLGVASR